MTKAHQLKPARCKKAVTFDQAKNEWIRDSFFIYETKEDGNRYLLQVRPNGARQNYLTSRRISVETHCFVEKQDKLPQVRDHKFPESMNDTVFDGEWVGGEDSNEAAHAIANGEGYYVVWDILRYGGQDWRNLALKFRRKRLYEMQVHFPSWMRLITASPDPKDLAEKVESSGGEGMVRKNLQAAYGEEWTKAKKIATYDVIIWGYWETKSDEWASKDWIGALLIGQWQKVEPKPGKTIPYDEEEVPQPGMLRNYCGRHYHFVDVGRCSGLTNEQRAEISRRRALFLGRPLEVECNKRFPSGKFRHPRFNRWRKDKNALECLYEPVEPDKD